MFKNFIASINFKILTLFLVGWIFLSIFSIYLNYAGRDLPEKQALQYAEGKLLAEKITYKSGRTPSNSTRIEISLFTFNPLHETKFGCSHSYTSYFIGCENITAFNGKMAKIGWYQQTVRLGFLNSEPQLVTAEVEGKEVVSYDDTLHIISLNNNLMYAKSILLSFVAIGLIKSIELLIYFFYIIFKK